MFFGPCQTSVLEGISKYVFEDVVKEMAKLGTAPTPSDETMKAIEKFVCELYVPKTALSTVKDLRWNKRD